MIKSFCRWLDVWVTVAFLLLALVLTLLNPPVFATPGGLLLARIILSAVGIFLAAFAAAARFHAAARGLLRSFLLFFPMLVAVLGYVALRLLHAEKLTALLGIAPRDPWMIAADNALFGKTPFLWFAQWGLDGHLFERVMAALYGLYPLMPFAVLGWFFFKRDMDRFYLVRRTLILSLYLGYCCYILVPVAGPLSLLHEHALFIDSTTTYGFLMSNFRYSYDCFPSLHCANPWLMAWLCRGRLPRSLMAVLVFVCAGITVSTIVLRLHYGIDLVAGLIWACAMAGLGRASLRLAATSPAAELREEALVQSA